MADQALTDEVTTAQAAAILGRSAWTVNRWAAEGKLPVARQLPGATGARLFRRTDVDALLLTPGEKQPA